MDTNTAVRGESAPIAVAQTDRDTLRRMLERMSPNAHHENHLDLVMPGLVRFKFFADGRLWEITQDRARE